MLKRVVLVLVLAGFVGCAFWLADVMADRRYVVAVVAAEPMYKLPPHEYPASNPIVGTVSPGQSVEVLRVRYGKDFEALQLRLPDGQSGWVLSGGCVRVLSRG